MTTLTEQIGRTYDEFPYLSGAFQVTAPEHLRTVAHLFGLDAPAPERARVLELGCAAGGNLIPFAARYPHAEVTGIELSQVQVDAGQRAIAAMGLKNLRLVQASIADLDESLGEFDYIICHGVYSWVPPEVQEAIVRVASQCLAPDGIAYVSYNTYPGWKAKEVVRDAMLLRANGRTDAGERLAYARGMVDFLHDMAPQGSVLAKIMGDNIDTIRHGEDYYLAHEYLELCNSPCYFRDFLAGARKHGLDFLAEAHVSSMFADNYGAEQAKLLLAECEGDQVRLEQLLDFLGNRTFRQTLLVHSGRTGQIRYQLDASRISQLHVAGNYTPTSDDGCSWATDNGRNVTASSEVAQSMICALTKAWPGTVPVATLVKAANAIAPGEEGKEQLMAFIGALIVGNAVHCRLDPMPLESAIPSKPKSLPALRALSGLGAATPIRLFSQWHYSLEPGVAASFLLPLLDGRNDRPALVAALVAAVAEQRLTFDEGRKTIDDPQQINRLATDAVTQALAWMSSNAMLAGASR
ncbi:class I SAM-dependent methyltransferase [Lysobacter arenosi]|uniref:Class I SAM-dependent methyltransferase n=1 Tax=Lysobacter arenosi TaxID=2795387 RepID=A0ABX7REL0_9GAMM|nr:methyltransferase regulatory domain-containing protein [Lysobacter arenosi]QSX75827.1 class I SAM-dependent methyltransferase [Lysobacter arenosi]